MAHNIILRHLHQSISRNNFTFKDTEIIDKLTEIEWCLFFNSYIDQKIHNAHPDYTTTCSITYNPDAKLKVSLKDF